MTAIDYSQKIPNNVNLSHDKRLQRALENWQPDYIDWWRSMGPTDFKAITGLSRRHAIPLMEWLDTQGVTLRQDNCRVLREA